MTESIQNISPLDGRYREKVKSLSPFFSEFGLIRTRVLVECEYLISLSEEKNFSHLEEFSDQQKKEIRSIYENFSVEDAKRVKEIEKITNHDIKAVEYFLKEREEFKNSKETEFIHFALTSEDINSTSYAIMLKKANKEVLIPETKKVLSLLKQESLKYKGLAFPARTHGQSASPTTLGKEFLVFHERIKRQVKILEKQSYLGKFSGATGNFSSFVSANPKVDWILFSKKFLEKLGIEQNLVTTQIEPHDFIVEICDTFRRISMILIDLSQDFWRYISDDFFIQKLKENEVGSSAMPHKINPIDFENAEGNFALANSMFDFFARKLPISRLQRDLSDSTSLRNLGLAFGYIFLGFSSLQNGLSKISPNEKKILDTIKNTWEILAEPIQTILRLEGVEKPYEKLKKLSRGKKIDSEKIVDFVSGLKISKEAKEKILALRPESYLGLAKEISEKAISKS